MKKNNKNITIGWTDAGNVHSGFIAYIIQILLYRHETIDNVIVSSGHYLSNNKNRIVSQFLESESEWLLLLDSDVLLDLDNFDRLVDSAEKNTLPIVSGLYFIPAPDGTTLYPAAMKIFGSENGRDIASWLSDWEDGEIVKGLHSTGAGFLLIHRSVYEKVDSLNKNKKQWFQDEYWPKPYDAWVSEDIYFFEMVRELGIEIALNTSAVSDHLKTFRLNKSHFLKTAYGIDNSHEHHHGNSYGSRKKLSWWVFGKPK